MTQQTQVLFIYLFSKQGQGESADSSEHRSNLLQNRLPKRIMM